jgi:hypothetical protein
MRRSIILISLVMLVVAFILLITFANQPSKIDDKFINLIQKTYHSIKYSLKHLRHNKKYEIVFNINSLLGHLVHIFYQSY